LKAFSHLTTVLLGSGKLRPLGVDTLLDMARSKQFTIIRLLMLTFVMLNFLGFSEAKELSEVKYKDGMVSVKGDQVPLLTILEKICESAGLKIIVLNPFQTQTVSINMVEKPVEAVLKNILRDQDYAVIYSSEGSGYGVRLMGDWRASVGENRGKSKISESMPVEEVDSEGSQATEKKIKQDKSIGAKLLKKNIEEFRRQAQLNNSIK